MASNKEVRDPVDILSMLQPMTAELQPVQSTAKQSPTPI